MASAATMAHSSSYGIALSLASSIGAHRIAKQTTSTTTLVWRQQARKSAASRSNAGISLRYHRT